MHRRQITGLLAATACLATTPLLRAADVSQAEAATGLRAALERGAQAAVSLLGREDGFLGNPKVRIPLPKFLEDAAKLLKLAGQQKRVDELVTAMNRAAEAAVPEARSLLVDAVKSMSVGDARRIIGGGEDSVTRFFAEKTRVPLGERFLPIVTRETRRVDLAARFNAVARRAADMGLLKGDDADIERYVTRKALDGLYFMIGEEERKIRRDPIGTGSAILAKVFGR
ncbi:MAG TPA: DUF4197 domain-containing protein [Caldimonas sp.]|jgi:hypothetical protein|nr:DUF4197 domain-containing protein [Caldimonas sp.]HEX2540462.1 DUF4197 domain-containing protein [Caldimonas sp.]